MKNHIILLVVVLFWGLLPGCAVQETVVDETDAADEAAEIAFQLAQEAAGVNQESYRIQPGDHLEVKFFYNSDLNASAVVRPDGKIALQLVGEVQAAGLTLTELDEALTKSYSVELLNPEITINVSDFQGLRIYVGGEVYNQGYIAFRNNMSALQAVLIAGGFKGTADPGSTLVIRKDRQNQAVSTVVDLEKVLAGEASDADFFLLPDDIIYVPRLE